jgi:uncharacterized membrane protein
MNPEQFLDRLEHHQIVDAIHKAEHSTTGHIRVYISHAKSPDPIAAALRRFHSLKMHRNPHHNGILIFVAPKSQTFAVIGGQSIHEKVGDAAWQSLAAGIGKNLKSNRFTNALVLGIEQAAELLHTHFPRTPSHH